MSAVPVVRQAGEGEQRWFAGGGLFTVKATAAETDGAFLMFEDTMVRGKTTPLHVHPHNDEAIYVLEGEILADVEGQQHTVGPGGLLFAPRGVPHAFLVTSETARVLAILTPAIDDFYIEASDPASSADDAARPPDFARLSAVAERSPSIEILGPPPFEPAATPA